MNSYGSCVRHKRVKQLKHCFIFKMIWNRHPLYKIYKTYHIQVIMFTFAALTHIPVFFTYIKYHIYEMTGLYSAFTLTVESAPPLRFDCSTLQEEQPTLCHVTRILMLFCFQVFFQTPLQPSKRVSCTSKPLFSRKLKLINFAASSQFSGDSKQLTDN